jgi:hypothetical protein
MKPVMQTIFPTEEKPMQGNCFAACIASILEISIEDVPDFCAKPGDWATACNEWLANFGLALLSVKAETEPFPMFPLPAGVWCLPYGITDRHPTRLHSIVGRSRGGLSDGRFDIEYVHDPFPGGNKIQKLKGVDFLIPIDPSKMKDVAA